MMQYLFDHKLLPAAERPLYTTFLASSFRTLRFGLHEAHGRGMAIQVNYLMEKGAFVAEKDGTFSVNLEKALRLADRLGGHLVSGHVGGVVMPNARFYVRNHFETPSLERGAQRHYVRVSV